MVTPLRRILLARHGQTSWNAQGKLQGHTDIPLNVVGREQADALAQRLLELGVRAIWTSDLCRARETGERVARALGLAAPQIDPGLRERGFGVFEGLTRDECALHHPEAWRAYHAQGTAPPGGEPREAAVTRVHRALIRIATDVDTPDPVLVVSHGGLMRLWLMDHLATAVTPIPNGAIYELDFNGTGFTARALATAR